MGDRRLFVGHLAGEPAVQIGHKSSRGASLPNRAARNSIAVFICSASKSSARTFGGFPRNKPSTKRRTVRSLTTWPLTRLCRHAQRAVLQHLRVAT
jgi:hypothetical protein